VCCHIDGDIYGMPIAKRASQNLTAVAVLLRISPELATPEEKNFVNISKPSSRLQPYNGPRA
jgi:hypothetical protein